MATEPAGLNRFYLLLGAVALAGGGTLLYLAKRPASVSIPVDVTVVEADTAGFRGYILGSDSAGIEVSEYADYQCPACGVFETVQFPDVRARLIETGRVRWRFRDYPLSQHPHARLAAHSAACAADQGKFWEQHWSIFEGQGDWSEKRDAGALFREYAKQNGLDLGGYDSCMKSAKYAGRIQGSLNEGMRRPFSSAVGSTPAASPTTG